MTGVTENTALVEFVALVSEALEDAGIVATLSGGAAVSIYTENRYLSEDLDFVTIAQIDELKSILEPLGFCHTGRPRMSVFDHPSTKWQKGLSPLVIDLRISSYSNCAANTARGRDDGQPCVPIIPAASLPISSDDLADLPLPPTTTPMRSLTISIYG